MKRNSSLPLLLGIPACLILAGVAYYWATGQMDSLFAYRSPLHDHPPVPDQAVGPPLTSRVVFILVDALRLDTSLNHEVMPFLNDLRKRGASAVMHSRPPSYSEPGYAVLLTGAWPDLSDGPTINLPYEEIFTPTQDNLFSASSRSGLSTALSGYYWFEKLVPQGSVNASYYTAGEDQVADRKVVDAALPWLREGKYNFILIHIDQVDYAGHHEGGPVDPRWNAAAHRADDLIREIEAELDLKKDTLFVTSDHGQIERGGHGGPEPVLLLEPFVLVGAGVNPGAYSDVNMVDVAPTLAVLLGANLPASSQGRVLEEMLALGKTHMDKLPMRTYTQQKGLVDAYQAAIESHVDVDPPMQASAKMIVEAYQRALEDARLGRLRFERLSRTTLAVVIVIIPLLFIIWRRSKSTLWLLAGVMLYHALFHFRYAVVDRLTYSLSWVPEPNVLIQYIAITAVVALVVSWIIVWWGLQTWKRTPREAAELGLDFTLLVIYVLSLPAMWSFAMNGALVSWTLPDFPSLYLGFISVLQIMVVAVVGLVASGVASLASLLVLKLSADC